MSLVDLINKIGAVDRTLQRGANNIAHKVNEFVGLGNYQISSAMFGASAVIMGSKVVDSFITYHNPVIIPIYAALMAFPIYQIIRNLKLERRENQSYEQSGDAMATDFELLEEKRALFGFQGFRAKRTYAFALAMAIPISTPLVTSFYIALLLGQYFREADHLMPTKKNAVFDFLKSLIPKPQLKTRYETPMSLEAQNTAAQYASIAVA